MFNSTGIKKETYGNVKQILKNVNLQESVGIVVDETAGVLNSAGRKIVKAGTPLKGNLDERTTAFTASTLGTDAVGVLLHDVDVTTGDNNGTLLIFGFVNVDRIDATVMAKNNEHVKKALKGIYFLK